MLLDSKPLHVGIMRNRLRVTYEGRVKLWKALKGTAAGLIVSFAFSLDKYTIHAHPEAYLFYTRNYSYTAPDLGFFVPYFDLDVVRFPTPPCRPS